MVTHEIGHELGATHTFNGTEDACGRQRHESTAYEPGSGSTIMGYALNCMPQTIQPLRDRYFHAISIEQITNNLLVAENLLNCPKGEPTGNRPPTIALAEPSTLRVPVSTPFELAVVGNDPDGDKLHYTFEQFDLGTEAMYGHDNDQDGVLRPMFRSRELTVARRAFPSVKNVIQRQDVVEYEAMPSKVPRLTFRIMARDQRGGFAYTDAVVNVDLNTDEFVVTAPEQKEVLRNGQQTTVRWKGDAKTRPWCPNVKISISTDGGTKFTTLVASTPNNGSATVTVPNVSTKQAVIRVDGVGQVFFSTSRLFTIRP